jgi:hypothetical protein
MELVQCAVPEGSLDQRSMARDATLAAITT